MQGRKIAILATLAVVGLGACGQSAKKQPRTAAGRPDPRTVRALLSIARRFNVDYADNHAAAVYARWDARSQTIIAPAAYLRRHQGCDTGTGPGFVQGATHRGRWWLVHYAISGVNLTDYWSYQRGRWVFDLFRSNPQAVGLYRLPLAKYYAAVGCSPHS